MGETGEDRREDTDQKSHKKLAITVYWHDGNEIHESHFIYDNVNTEKQTNSQSQSFK